MSKAQTTHTPTPWFVVEHRDGEDWTIQTLPLGAGAPIAMRYGDSTKANAEFIVRAVNSHEALLSALKDLELAMTGMPIDWKGPHLEMLDAARAAIALAEKGA